MLDNNSLIIEEVNFKPDALLRTGLIAGKEGTFLIKIKNRSNKDFQGGKISIVCRQFFNEASPGIVDGQHIGCRTITQAHKELPLLKAGESTKIKVRTYGPISGRSPLGTNEVVPQITMHDKTSKPIVSKTIFGEKSDEQNNGFILHTFTIDEANRNLRNKVLFIVAILTLVFSVANFINLDLLLRDWIQTLLFYLF